MALLRHTFTPYLHKDKTVTQSILGVNYPAEVSKHYHLQLSKRDCHHGMDPR